MNDISLEDFATQLTEACMTYTEETVEKVESGIEQIGKEATAEVKSLSPVDEGKYKRSWTCNIEKAKGTFVVTVHVKGKEYRLTHLLEYGHMNRDGTSRARAFPHIEKANEHAHEKVNELLEGL